MKLYVMLFEDPSTFAKVEIDDVEQAKEYEANVRKFWADQGLNPHPLFLLKEEELNEKEIADIFEKFRNETFDELTNGAENKNKINELDQDTKVELTLISLNRLNKQEGINITL